MSNFSSLVFIARILGQKVFQKLPRKFTMKLFRSKEFHYLLRGTLFVYLALLN